MRRVFISGEGSNEIGDWVKEPMYRVANLRRPDVVEGGVLEALCRKEIPEGWRIVDAIKWDKLAKRPVSARVRGPNPEHRTVLQLALLAQESQTDTLIFARDTDGDPEREAAIRTGVAEAIQKFPDLAIGGGPVIKRLENWIAALLGMIGAERLSDEQVTTFLLRHDIKVADKDTAKMLAVVAEADLSSLPGDATSLREWLRRVRAALSDTASVPSDRAMTSPARGA